MITFKTAKVRFIVIYMTSGSGMKFSPPPKNSEDRGGMNNRQFVKGDTDDDVFNDEKNIFEKNFPLRFLVFFFYL